MKYQINYENAMSNHGNWDRICRVIERASAGESLVIGFLGGSITMGSLSSTPQTCYAYHVYEWWCRTFPNAKFSYINAGIGATDSQFGCARAESDLLRYEPDFVVVDFSVNDESTEHFLETYEGVIRKLYYAEKKPAVMLLHNVYYHDGSNAQLQHAKIARHYDIPAVSMQSSIYPELLAGRIENRAITPDDLHPNDDGHELVASVIIHVLEQIRVSAGMEVKSDSGEAEKVPLTANAYEDSIRYQNDSAVFTANGFVADQDRQDGITDIFKNGWTAAHTNDKISFEIECSCLAVQYRKSVQQPVPKAKAVIDGDEAHAVILDGNFTEDWGDCLYLEPLLHHAEKKAHRIEITVTDAKDIVRPFYLVSLIVS